MENETIIYNQEYFDNLEIENIRLLFLWNKEIIGKIDLTRFTHLIYLEFCNNPNITELPQLPNSLIYLYCYNTNITKLPSTLPNSLMFLHCYNTKITELPPLPNTLWSLNCSNTKITELPPLPNTLMILRCDDNPQLIYTFTPTIENINTYNKFIKTYRQSQGAKIHRFIRKHQIRQFYNPNNIEQYYDETTGTLDETHFI